MADPQVRVRMYRPGLGDCFLVTVTRQKKKSHVLIDCGRFQGSGFADIGWDDIVADIRKQCAGKLDAVVITHEHSDHLSGFHENLNDFRTMAKGELWLAWTEDPNQTILPSEKKSLQALREAGTRLGASAKSNWRDIGEGVLGVLGFSPRTDKEFEEIKALWPKSKQKLFDPGDVIEREWLHGVKVHVLGPPKDKKLMSRALGVEGQDMYHKLASISVDEDDPSKTVAFTEAKDRMPFERSFRWTREKAENAQPFKDRLASYADSEWRKIDDDWLDSLQRLALQFDNSVNNTSLVLAFELPDSGNVLLFVGDAQIGNWQSWANVTFKNPGTTTADLLRRVVFYKCGHHGSHNSTLKKGGLEAMPHGIQVAIPTNNKFALGRKPHPWVMPADGITEAMKHRKDKVKRPDDKGVKDPFIDFKF